jgi:hypothetical protein
LGRDGAKKETGAFSEQKKKEKVILLKQNLELLSKQEICGELSHLLKELYDSPVSDKT